MFAKCWQNVGKMLAKCWQKKVYKNTNVGNVGRILKIYYTCI